MVNKAGPTLRKPKIWRASQTLNNSFTLSAWKSKEVFSQKVTSSGGLKDVRRELGGEGAGLGASTVTDKRS